MLVAQFRGSQRGNDSEALLLAADRPFWRGEATRSGQVLLVGLGEIAVAHILHLES